MPPNQTTADGHHCIPQQRLVTLCRPTYIPYIFLNIGITGMGRKEENDHKNNEDFLLKQSTSCSLITLLIDSGQYSSLNVKGSMERTPLDIALTYGNEKGARLLQDSGGIISKFGSCNSDGWNGKHVCLMVDVLTVVIVLTTLNTTTRDT